MGFVSVIPDKTLPVEQIMTTVGRETERQTDRQADRQTKK